MDVDDPRQYVVSNLQSAYENKHISDALARKNDDTFTKVEMSSGKSCVYTKTAQVANAKKDAMAIQTSDTGSARWPASPSAKIHADKE
jgi:hypothetical protein